MNRTPLRTRLLFLLVTTALTVLAVPGSAQAAPYCGITWGSGAEQAGNSAPAGPREQLAAVRSGRHACFDRLVLDVTGTTSVDSYRVEYVRQVTADGSGARVPLRGGAYLQITVAAHGQAYAPAVRRELVDVAGYRTFRQVAWAGSFEGYTSIGLGVRAQLPVRVFELHGPGNTVRVVIDVAHRW